MQNDQNCSYETRYPLLPSPPPLLIRHHHPTWLIILPDIHGGITEHDIISLMDRAIRVAHELTTSAQVECSFCGVEQLRGHSASCSCCDMPFGLRILTIRSSLRLSSLRRLAIPFSSLQSTPSPLINRKLMKQNFTIKEMAYVFLDEINTASCMGLFKEIICDHSMRGTKLPSNLIVIAACNPYRFRLDDNPELYLNIDHTSFQNKTSADIEF